MNESRWPARWRTKAADLRRYGANDLATALETCAAEIEAEAREHMFEELTVEGAAAEAGVCEETIRRRVRRGDLENIGNGNRIAIRRADLLPNAEPHAVIVHGEPDVVEERLRNSY